MKRIHVYFVLGTAVLAALAVAACARDRGGPAGTTDPAAGPLPPVPMAGALVREREWAVYIGASATHPIAGEVFVLTPGPQTAVGVMTAATAWNQACTRLVTCQMQAAGAIG